MSTGPWIKKNDLIGREFERLKVVGKSDREHDYVSPSGRRKPKWDCECKCGKKLKVIGESLLNGNTTSCGCFQKDDLAKRTWKGFQEISGVYWGKLKKDAKHRNIVFDTTIEDAWDLFLQQDRKCALTGVPIIFARKYKGKGVIQTASLDRKDSKIGYVVGNLQWVHKSINVIKWDWDIEELYGWCELLLAHRKVLSNVS